MSMDTLLQVKEIWSIFPSKEQEKQFLSSFWKLSHLSTAIWVAWEDFKAFSFTIKDYTRSQAATFLGWLTGKPNSDERTAEVGAKQMWELQVWRGIQYEEERNSMKLKIQFTVKIFFCLRANLRSPGYKGVFSCSWFTSLKGLILLESLSASVLSSSVLHCTIPLDLDEEYQPQ